VSPAYVDAVRVVDVVDGFAVSLSATTEPETHAVDLSFEAEAP